MNEDLNDVVSGQGPASIPTVWQIGTGDSTRPYA